MAPAKIKKTVVVRTTQELTDRPADVEGFFMRNWSVEVHIRNDAGEILPANIYKKVVYILHPSFVEERQRQTFEAPPFKIEEEGWGEFVMSIELHTLNDEVQLITHDLNFQKTEYDVLHQVEFRKIGGEVGEIIRELSVDKKKSAVKEKKRDPRKSAVDMNRLAEILVRLPEDVLFEVVQTIKENMNENVYIKNDPENGEFHVDLYSLPDSTVKKIWEKALTNSQG